MVPLGLRAFLANIDAMCVCAQLKAYLPWRCNTSLVPGVTHLSVENTTIPHRTLKQSVIENTFK
jgi:hypothetical protein